MMVAVDGLEPLPFPTPFLTFYKTLRNRSLCLISSLTLSHSIHKVQTRDLQTPLPQSWTTGKYTSCLTCTLQKTHLRFFFFASFNVLILTFLSRTRIGIRMEDGRR